VTAGPEAAYTSNVLSVSIVGPVEVRRSGQILAVPAGKSSELLVRLALDVGRPVTTDRLIEDLWGDEAITTRRNTVQSKITKLRRAIGDPTIIVATDNGYVLSVDQNNIDFHCVLTGAADVGGMHNDSDMDGTAERCSHLLAMFRGDLLPDAGDGDWVIAHRARLEAARLQLLESSFRARSMLGDSSVIVDLEAALVEHPYLERFWELLITTLYRNGRQSDALHAYQRVRAQLADELGLELGPQLRLLEQQILSHDHALAPTGTAIGSAQAGTVGNLPALSVGLIGRDADADRISGLVAEHRLVEIVGPGGVGKTAIAIAVGQRLATETQIAADGVWLARLETATSAAGVLDVVLAALDVTGGWTALRERLRRSRIVIVLDNCEHVLEAVTELVDRLLGAGPYVRLVCTTQIPLDIDGGSLYELAPLALDEAIALFTIRASAQRRSQRVNNDNAVTDLCRSLDGLPLAIELAAARTKTLSVDEINRRLDDRFSVLSDPTSRKSKRRRALKATIRWSYDLLFPDDQRGLWALATFAGGATLPAVETVLAVLDVPADATLDIITRLVNRSLVVVDDNPTSNRVRYRLLDSIRAFAIDEMRAADADGVAAAAQARWYSAAAAGSTDGVRSSRQADHLAFARAERANIDIAIAWTAVHNPTQALDMVNGFGWAWLVLGDSRGVERLNAALTAAGDAAAPAARATALLLLGWLEASIGDLAVAHAHVEDSLEIADTLGDSELLARCCYYLAYVVSHHGDFRQGIALTDRSRTLYDQLDRPWDQAANALFAARAAISAGDHERSVAARHDVERWLNMVDDPWLHVRYEAMLGELARLQRRFVDAVTHIARAVETSRTLGFLQTEAYQTGSLGRAQLQTGDYTAGINTLGLAINKAEATGDHRMATLARVHLGRALRSVGETARARVELESAAEWHRQAGGGEQAALGEVLLAALDLADNRNGARERLIETLATAQINGIAHVEVFALDALARAAHRDGDPRKAAERVEQADQRMSEASHFISDRDRVDSNEIRSTPR
jgi:predicted ATPase/DNA-binding SARP family transcriptional activator